MSNYTQVNCITRKARGTELTLLVMTHLTKLQEKTKARFYMCVICLEWELPQILIDTIFLHAAWALNLLTSLVTRWT